MVLVRQEMEVYCGGAENYIRSVYGMRVEFGFSTQKY